MANTFHYQLDLVVWLLDTTTGCPVTEQQVLFVQDGQTLPFHFRGAGVYVLLDGERKDGKMTVAVRGYLETAVDIRYGELTGRYPEVYVALIPDRPKYGSCDFVDISGTLSGISSISAVSLTDPFGKVVSYNAGKRQIKLSAARKLDEQAYALIHEQAECFEEFHVASAKNKLLLRLTQPLETELKPEEEISRIVRGRVEKNGNYLLRLREDGQGTHYLVRYVIKGRTTFKKITAESAGDPGNRED